MVVSCRYLIPKKAVRSEWNKRMKGVKAKGTANEAMTEWKDSTEDFQKIREILLKWSPDIFERKTVTPRRLEWAAKGKSKGRGFVERLVIHSNALERLLGSTLVRTIYLLQQKAYVAMLQLDSNVVDLQKLSNATKITTDPVAAPNALSSVTYRLVDSRVGQVSYPDETLYIDPISIDETMKKLHETRLEAEYPGKEVWIEWKGHPIRDIHNPRWEVSSKIMLKD